MKQTAKLGALLLAGLVLLTLTACADHSEEPVGSCGPYEILYEELRYHTMTYREEHPDCSVRSCRQPSDRSWPSNTPFWSWQPNTCRTRALTASRW